MRGWARTLQRVALPSLAVALEHAASVQLLLSVNRMLMPPHGLADGVPCGKGSPVRGSGHAASARSPRCASVRRARRHFLPVPCFKVLRQRPGHTGLLAERCALWPHWAPWQESSFRNIASNSHFFPVNVDSPSAMHCSPTSLISRQPSPSFHPLLSSSQLPSLGSLWSSI